MASAVAKPAPTTSPISSSKYGKCHLSGASTTPSSEMKKCDLILRTREPPWLDLEERVHLADRLREHLERAHALELLHVLAGLEREAQLHAGPAVLLGEPHAGRGGRQPLVRCAVAVGEAVGELEQPRRGAR